MTTSTSPISDDKLYTKAGRVMRLRLPRTVLYGRGSALVCTEYLRAQELERVLVLSDENLMAAGVGAELIAALEQRSEAVETHLRTPGEPKVSEVDAIGEAARAFSPTAIVAIGGGATLDTAKIVKILAGHDLSVRDLMDSGIPESPVALVVVATTSGTGSETGKGSIVVDDHTGEKLGVSSPPMYAEVAVVDPDLTVSMPPKVTAATGMDALCQAIGAYLCNYRTPVTDVLAEEAIALLAANLTRAVKNGDDVEARSAMAHGSLLSGIAMNNSGAIADQYFDEILGPRYRIPHGTVAGLLMPYVIQYNRTEAEERVSRLAHALVQSPPYSVQGRAELVVSRLAELYAATDLPSLPEMGIAEGDMEQLARDVASHYAVEAELDPRAITEEGALAILRAAYHGEEALKLSV
jgi:alcohol dehydrogenase